MELLYSHFNPSSFRKFGNFSKVRNFRETVENFIPKLKKERNIQKTQIIDNHIHAHFTTLHEHGTLL